MEGHVAHLTGEERPLLGPIVRRRIPTARARLTRVIGIHLHRHATSEQGFVGEVAVQLREGPLGGAAVGLPLLLACLPAMPAFGSLADVGQVLQADEAVRARFQDAPTDDMAAVLLEPSLSSAHYKYASLRG